MITGITGFPGGGKTLVAVSQMETHKRVQAGLRAKGRHWQKTCANFHSITGLWDFKLWDDIRSEANACIWIDEAHMWFPSREHYRTKQAELAIFQQSRKQGLDMVWIAQHEARIDVAVRELTAFIWRIRKVGPVLLMQKFAPETPRTILARRFVVIDPGWFQHYLTEEVIGERNGDGYQIGASTAYGGAAANAGLVNLDGRLVLAPNIFRIEMGDSVAWTRADDPWLATRIGAAVEWARSRGLQGAPWQLVTPFYRSSSGRMLELDVDLTAKPSTVEPHGLQLVRGVFHEAAQDAQRSARETLAVLERGAKERLSRIGGLVEVSGQGRSPVEPGAVTPMDCAGSVAEGKALPGIVFGRGLEGGPLSGKVNEVGGLTRL